MNLIEIRDIQQNDSYLEQLKDSDLKAVTGGAVCGGLCVAGIIVLAGAAGVGVGYGVAAWLD